MHMGTVYMIWMRVIAQLRTKCSDPSLNRVQARDVHVNTGVPHRT